MRDIHYRVSESMYARILEEAEQEGVSVAHFAREATIVRTTVYAHRRGMTWGVEGDWAEVVERIAELDKHDAKLRADQARARRQRKRR